MNEKGGEYMTQGEKLQKLIEDCFNGDRGNCASILGISESTVSRIINGNNKPGRSVIAKIMNYCNENNIDFNKYLSF